LIPARDAIGPDYEIEVLDERQPLERRGMVADAARLGGDRCGAPITSA
jgi:hypothetical protein